MAINPIKSFQKHTHGNLNISLPYTHGVGGSPEWWKKYDKAKAYFDKHQNLDGFSNKAWIISTRMSGRKKTLSDDQVHFLKQIDFDFSPKQGKPRNNGKKIDETRRLMSIFNEEGVDGLSVEERKQLRSDLTNLRKRYTGGQLSEDTGEEFGLGVDGNVNALIVALK